MFRDPVFLWQILLTSVVQFVKFRGTIIPKYGYPTFCGHSDVRTLLTTLSEDERDDRFLTGCNTSMTGYWDKSSFTTIVHGQWDIDDITALHLLLFVAV